MRTRAESKRRKQSPGTLADISEEAVGRLLKRANKRSCSGKKKHDNISSRHDSIDTPEIGPNRNDKLDVDPRDKWNISEVEGCNRDALQKTAGEERVDRESIQNASPENVNELNDLDWEDGSIPILGSTTNLPVTIEISETPNSNRRKPARRSSAEDKELAELMHKVHLLCLLARGRLIDSACDDPLIQASLLSLLPKHLLNTSKVTQLTATALYPLVHWFQNNFHVRSSTSAERSFRLGLAFALETREGTPEEIVALSVALFRALNLTTRFLSILDVASLKPDAGESEIFSQDASRLSKGIFKSSTLMVARPNKASVSPVKSFSSNAIDNICETSQRGSCKSQDSYSACGITQSEGSSVAGDLDNKMSDSLACEAGHDTSEECLTKKVQGTKRKGDLEFERQLEIALSATAGVTLENKIQSNARDLDGNSMDFSSPLKRVKRIVSEESPSSQGISTAVGSRKVGSPLYWAEVYCSGENLTGKWVHVDVVNAVVDGEQKVEAMAAACKTSLRYVVAFAGRGAKDVTRRYCMKWYKIASLRVNSIWWDAVLAPLKELEAGATGGMVHMDKQQIESTTEHEKAKTSRELGNPNQDVVPGDAILHAKSTLEVVKEYGKKIDIESSVNNSFVATRSSLEDMELETRALTEPLPTNQQAYRSHQLYAIERWLTKYQVLYPKAPVLGFCSGHPVYPRSCVQTLKTKERWLREGLQVKAHELPVKELKRSVRLPRVSDPEDDECGGGNYEGTIQLYGKWQLEALHLPRAVDGIVPKNERGQVEVWSEKCLPPGTVHLRLPRVFYVAKRLEIDYAPAMVGFEFRNGRSHPIFDGIVVCAEFKDAILEAYVEEEERREAEEKKRNEMQAISRWYQLLCSIITRQRLNNRYGDSSLAQTSTDIQRNSRLCAPAGGCDGDRQSLVRQQEGTHRAKLDASSTALSEDHEHVFLTENQSFDDESLVLIKRCHCGFSVQVEEL
ncbi:DNA repair protein RAD4 isoform X2 [Juglans microcarpa x Juglans regia]|uniref:DNA repair protein RAD4 isoform X2 n=1 Tax=Juglans microcarpa x Juglans regia TaxID=2249226 RepID=UPI001B7DF281|nr:DNA repair protein RAD4 isoform X2 [Juglans microcarpa x Juglans regia]